MDKNKKKSLLIVAMAGIIGVCTGCGSQKTVHIDAGMSAIEEQNYDAALECFDKAVVSDENLELAYRGQGISYMGLMQYEEAVSSFEKALKSAGMFPGELEYDINFYMATAKYKNGDIDAAIAIFDGILAMQKKNTDAYFLRGSAKIMKDDYEGAIKDLEQALALSENSIDMLVQVYNVLKEGGHKEDGIEYLALRLDKGTDLTDYDKGTLAFYLEDYENARNYLETARNDKKIKEQNASDIVYMLGRTYEQLGDRNYAAVMYEEYLKTNSEDVVILNQLGLCKLAAEDYEGALSAFQSAMQLDSEGLSQNLKYNEIVIYEHLGEFNKAKVLMETYLKAYPDDASAQREYEFLKSR